MTSPSDVRSAEQRFHIGEVAILVVSFNYPEYNGQEVTVMGGLEPRFYYNRDRRQVFGPEMRYLVEAGDGHKFAIPPDRLRKRRPPQDWVSLCALDSTPVDEVPA